MNGNTPSGLISNDDPQIEVVWFILISIRVTEMYSAKIDNDYGCKLYGSAVTDGRSKASSLYNKRPTYNVPDLQLNKNYLTPNYTPTDRTSKAEQSSSRLAMSYAGKIDLNPPINTYESNITGRGSYSYNEPKSTSRAPSATTRPRLNENDDLASILDRKRGEVSSNIQSLDANENTDNYRRRIMEKLNKKQKIIQELQKLCETKVSDSLRNSNGYEKGDYEVYSPVRRTKNVSTNSSGFTLKAVPTEKQDKLNVPTVYNTALTQSLNFDVNRKEFDSTFKISPEEISPARKGSYIDRQVRKVEKEAIIPARKSSYVDREAKMTEEESNSPVRKGSYVDRNRERAEPMRSKDSQRNISTAYNTPKESSSRGSQDFDYIKDKARVDTGKKYGMFEALGNDSYKPKDLTLSSKLVIPETTNLSEIYTRKSKQFEDSTRQHKPAKDVRQMMESKGIKNNSGYFSGSKKVSIYDFDLKKSLGEGKFGQVYQAFHKDSNSLYALKKISKKVIKSSMMVDQLLQQIKIQAYCTHENILKLYGFFDDSDDIYLILEYMEQGTLFSNLKQQKTLKQEDAKLKIKDIAKAVVYLHDEGIVHRDIKPENIVMSNNVCKLCDFGWAAICTDRRKTYCGTFDYVAPEILQGAEYDVSVDLWCLGVLAYELLVGKAPFYHISRKQTMKKIMKVEKLQYPANISQTAISFIESLIKKNPEDRLNGQDILRHPFLASAGDATI